FPVPRSCKKMSDTPFVSRRTRFDAPDSNATNRPVPAVRAAALLPLPCLRREETLAFFVRTAALAFGAMSPTNKRAAAAAIRPDRAAWMFVRDLIVLVPLLGRRLGCRWASRERRWAWRW